MNRVALVGLLALTVLLAGCLNSPGSNGDGGDTAANGQPGDTHTVTYTSSGFSPAALTIDQGDTVRWESDGTTMWVAVDQHPTHTHYDGTGVNQHCPSDGDVFDQCSTGSTYAFTFEKTGSWSYHNHRNAGNTGIITVQ